MNKDLYSRLARHVENLVHRASCTEEHLLSDQWRLISDISRLISDTLAEPPPMMWKAQPITIDTEMRCESCGWMGPYRALNKFPISPGNEVLMHTCPNKQCNSVSIEVDNA